MSQPSTPIEAPTADSTPAGETIAESSRTTSLAAPSALPVVLPPFRSATTFPRAPQPEQLPALYADCLQALQEANTARQIHKRRMQAKKQMITAIRLEIDRLEQDLALEAGTRASLHAMNLRLVEALQEMDDLVGELDQVVSEAHRVPRSGLGRLIDSLKALMQQWRLLKRRQRQEMAGLAGSEQDGEP